MGTTIALAISNDIFVMSGPDVTGIKTGALSFCWAVSSMSIFRLETANGCPDGEFHAFVPS
jgi:hypothetical protein